MSTAVVIPAHNYGKWLPEAVESARQADQIIVVDDGSTDSTPEAVAGISGVIYIRQAQAGVSAARTRGLQEVTTDYVCFLDADDVLLPGFIDRLAGVLGSHPLDVAFAYSSIQMFGTDERRLMAPAWDVERLKRENYVSLTSLFRVDAVRRTGFDPHVHGWEDWEFILALAAAGLRGVAVPDIAFGYRKHADEPSFFDSLTRANPVAEVVAARYIAGKHRGLFTTRDRLTLLARQKVRERRLRR